VDDEAKGLVNMPKCAEIGRNYLVLRALKRFL